MPLAAPHPLLAAEALADAVATVVITTAPAASGRASVRRIRPRSFGTVETPPSLARVQDQRGTLTLLASGRRPTTTPETADSPDRSAREARLVSRPPAATAGDRSPDRSAPSESCPQDRGPLSHRPQPLPCPPTPRARGLTMRAWSSTRPPNGCAATSSGCCPGPNCSRLAPALKPSDGTSGGTGAPSSQASINSIATARPESSGRWPA